MIALASHKTVLRPADVGDLRVTELNQMIGYDLKGLLLIDEHRRHLASKIRIDTDERDVSERVPKEAKIGPHLKQQNAGHSVGAKLVDGPTNLVDVALGRFGKHQSIAGFASGLSDADHYLSGAIETDVRGYHPDDF